MGSLTTSEKWMTGGGGEIGGLKEGREGKKWREEKVWLICKMNNFFKKGSCF